MASTNNRPTITGKTLREIAEERDAIDVFLSANEGELTPEIEAWLASNENDVKAKVQAIGLFVKREEQSVVTIGLEQKRLAERKQAIEKRIEWLKAYVAECLDRLGFQPGDSIKGALITVAVQANNPKIVGAPENPSVQYDPLDQDVLARWHREGVPFVSTRTVYSFDRKSALSALQGDASIVSPAMESTQKLTSHDVRVVRDASVRFR